MIKISALTIPLLAVLASTPSIGAMLEENTVTITNSNCVIVVQTDTESGKVDIEGLRCPTEAGKSFSVRYFWLNSLQVSFLLAKYSDANFAPMLGRKPIVFTNDVFVRLASIYDRFGTKASSIPEASAGFIVEGGRGRPIGESEGESFNFSNSIESIPLALRTKFKVPTFERDIVWPDFTAVDVLMNSPSWPSNYRAHYDPDAGHEEGGNLARQIERGAKRNYADVADKIAACMTLHRFVSAEEYRNYWPMVDVLEGRLNDGSAGEWQVDFFRSYVGSNMVEDIVANEAYDFHADIGAEFWPDDYMIVNGTLDDGEPSQEGCGEFGGGLSFLAIPRKMMTLVAVVAPLVDEVVVKSASIIEDSDRKLRSKLNFGQPVSVPLGDVVLKKSEGSSLIIPLRLEMRYSNLDVPFKEVVAPNAIEAALKKFPDHVVRYRHCEVIPDTQTEECKPFMIKKTGDFPDHQNAEVVSTYFFEKAYDIQSLNINGTVVDVRSAPMLSLVATYESEAGSCPFVYFEHYDGSISYYGRILVGAVGVAKTMTDKIPVPEGVKKVLIRELEPEVSYITGFHFDGETPPLAASVVRIMPRGQLSIDVPDGRREIAVTGYYIPLNRSTTP